MKISKGLDLLEEGVAGLLFVAGVIVSLYGVFMRYVMNAPPAWATEIFEFLMVWSIFIGFGMALKDNRHIQVELLFDALPTGAKKIVAFIANVIGGIYSFYLTYSSFELITLTKLQGTKTLDVGIPIWLTYLVLPVGMGLLGIYFFVKAYRSLKGDPREFIGEIDHIYESLEETNKEIEKKEELA
ncbi:TRAP transporter small permease [Domibacillus epiphyticus]|uniref:Tripartite ATP-independent periplasmic transporters DctQ component domain-containing protein n=1 Tax=Domibacillus epiphyticus TaxID=1714355 RepID=A0A1V2A4N9_9BACI|nr:TRAP transporter small permease [Domibacillus epiphyticus]OMP65969.1 hypothetical protein BTO28_14340 [Domibacillus epiphyticus]